MMLLEDKGVIYTARVGVRGTRNQYVVGLPKAWVEGPGGIALGEKVQFVFDRSKPDELVIKRAE